MAENKSHPEVLIRRLTVSQFRSYESLELETGARTVVLTGANGAGKTNLLEAISLLAPGRGLRSARLGEMSRRTGPAGGGYQAKGWAVALEVETPEGLRRLGTGLETVSPGAPGQRGGEGSMRERRLVKIDGVTQRGQVALGEVLRLVWLTPQMDGIFIDSAGERRRFLDRLVTGYDPDHSSRVHAYDYAMRERSRLLREGIEDDAWLSSLEDAMARHGIALAVARRTLVDRLARAASSGIGPFPAAGIDIACRIDNWLRETPALSVEDRFKAALADSRTQDCDNGSINFGPHRADLEVTHREKAMPARLASTGEQKALLTSIILAHARLLTLEQGAAPILLLDEVVAHLDARRRSALFREVIALGSQAWMTGTDAAVFGELGDTAEYFSLQDNRLLSRPGRPLGNAV